MGETTGISWADSTFSAWLGCVEVSPACDHCYARTLVTGRMGKPVWGKDAPRQRTSEGYWKQPLKWNALAEKSGKPWRVFCGSLCDVMEDRADLVEIRRDLYDLIERTPALTWLLLTKRPQNFRRFLRLPPAQNIWALTTVESPEYLWRIDALKGCGVQTLGLSVEPLLADMPTLGEHLDGISWVLVGGESGSGSRPMHPDWARRIRDFCVNLEIPFHFKQIGDWAWQGPHNANVIITPNGIEVGKDQMLLESGVSSGRTLMTRIGKKAAGHLLDGKAWLEFPEGK